MRQVWSGGHAAKVVARTLREAWRADVRASCTAAQLGLQIRLLDAHIRWEALKAPAPEREAKEGKSAKSVKEKESQEKEKVRVAPQKPKLRM